MQGRLIGYLAVDSISSRSASFVWREDESTSRCGREWRVSDWVEGCEIGWKEGLRTRGDSAYYDDKLWSESTGGIGREGLLKL